MKRHLTTVFFALVSMLVVALSGLVGWQIGSSSAPSHALPSTSSRTIPDSVPVVAFMGDSYTKGIGASSNGKRWTTLVSAAMGWSELNLAEGGSGYATTYLGQKTDYSIKLDVIAAAQPDIVVVSGGRNDYEAGTSPVVGVTAASLFESIKTLVPNAELIVTSPIWDSSMAPPDFATLVEAVKAAANSADARHIALDEPLAQHPWLLDLDGLHPNDAGYRVIAETVVTAMG